jgi:PAS domain S-box-containing protein
MRQNPLMTDAQPGARLPPSEFSEAVPRLPDVGIWEHLFPEDRLLLSDGFCHLVGADAAQALANPQFWPDSVHPEDLPRIRAGYRDFLGGGQNEFECLYRARHVDGRWRTLLARARWEARRDGTGRLVRGYVTDVTWRERLKLKAGVIERMSEGVVLLSRDGIIHFANQALESTLGYGPGELLGQHAQRMSFRSPEAFEGLLETAFAATENGSSALIDLESRRRDGTLLPLQGQLSSLVLGGTRYLAAVFTDISHRKQLEREVLQMATQVQHRVGGDLHEGLGQQLSGIAMMLNGLRQRASDVAPALCGQLDEVVALLNGAVSRTRVLARGLSPVRPSAEGLTEGFEELVNTVHEVYGQRVRLTMDLPPELSVDENSVMNLFHIAQEAVENAARHSAASDIAVSFRATGSELELQVVDDGVGFEPTQVSRGRLGMGLRMMRFRAEMARGYLSIESRPGQGARLRCRCPARTDRRE